MRRFATFTLFLLLTGSISFAQIFVPLPDLPGGAALSRARAISGGETVIVGMSSSISGDQATLWMRWPSVTVLGLGDLPGGDFASEAFACSANGDVIFGSSAYSGSDYQAFRWTQATGMQPLGFLASGGYLSRVYGCNQNGAIACGENVVQPPGSPPPLPVTQAFRWTSAGGMQGLGFLPGSGFYSSARGMSEDGSVIVGWATDAGNVNRPFHWTQATGMTDISGGAFTGLARAISADGVWVVGTNSTTSRAFIWNESTGAIDLPSLPGATSSAAASVLTNGHAFGVSGGQACHWYQGPCYSGWNVARVVDSFATDALGWNLTVAQGATNGSWVTGYGMNPEGQTQAWVGFSPGPGPACCCGVDFNGDGDTGTDADIEAFFACLAGNCCPTCYAPGADFNVDGDYGTDADIEAFFRALAGDCC